MPVDERSLPEYPLGACNVGIITGLRPRLSVKRDRASRQHEKAKGAPEFSEHWNYGRSVGPGGVSSSSTASILSASRTTRRIG